MKHYNYEEWKLFVEEGLEDSLRASMEEHLYQCDECMECYLSVIDTSIDIADGLIPISFTDNLMRLIEEEIQHPPQTKVKRQQQMKIGKNQILKYYSIAACITIVLFHYGIFDLIGESIPKAAEELANSTQRVEIVVTNRWSDRLINSPFQFLNNLKINRRRDFNEKE